MFRGYIMKHALSGAIELGQRNDYGANQERILVWLLRHTPLSHLWIGAVCTNTGPTMGVRGKGRDYDAG